MRNFFGLITISLVVGLTGCNLPGTDGKSDGGDSSERIEINMMITGSQGKQLLSADGVTAATDCTEFNNTLHCTPENIAGQVVSVLFTIDNTSDEGVVIYGDNRPDLVTESTKAKPIDFTKPTVQNGTFGVKPGFVGGNSSLLLMLFSYADVTLTINGETKIIRLVYGPSGDYTRGDKLLYNSSTKKFEWYDLDAQVFTATRPKNPAVLKAVRDYDGDGVYNALQPLVKKSILLDKDTVTNYNLDFAIGFDLAYAVTFSKTRASGLAAMTNADLIGEIDINERHARSSEGLAVDVVVDKIAKTKGSCSGSNSASLHKSAECFLSGSDTSNWSSILDKLKGKLSDYLKGT